MPSWHEGFGLVAWEAIAAGVPLIVSKNSGVYRLLEGAHPGAETGYVYPLEIRGAMDPPYFHPEDLRATVAALRAIAKDPSQARKKASTLRNILLETNTWAACAEQAARAFDWEIKKGSAPAVTCESVLRTASPVASARGRSDGDEPLNVPAGQWRHGAGMADSQLLRAEEALLPFDLARQPEVDKLNDWLDNTQWPQSVRLLTGAGGQGKTRLALEVCRQRRMAGWYAGFLDSNLEANRMTATWQVLRKPDQPVLIVIDYAETRQTAFLELLKAALKKPATQAARVLLLARDGGEWWDNLPSRDRQCEGLLSGYATSGPFRLPPLYRGEPDRREAYQKALQAFAQALDVTIPAIIPDLLGEHFERPLYVQMAALLALYGERPTTAQGLTKALLNHERRYWLGLLAHFNWLEPERRSEQLLALTTLAGGFSTSKAAEPYWIKASGRVLSPAEFNSLFRTLATLYPGSLGLQALRPDLLGEALVAQALLRPGADTILDAVLGQTASHLMRRNALTVLARLSDQRLDLQEMLVEAFSRNFGHCCTDLVSISTETTSRLPALAELAFARLSTVSKSQAAGMLAPRIIEESIQLAELDCLISKYLAEKSRERFEKKPGMERMADFARAVCNHSGALSRCGRYNQACSSSLEGVELFRRLALKDQRRFEADYAGSLSNYASSLSNVGQNDRAVQNDREALEIRKRLAERNPDQHEPGYARSLSNYSSHLSELGRNEEALPVAQRSLEIHKGLAEKNPDQYEQDYARSLTIYANRMRGLGRIDEAHSAAQRALEIDKRLADKKPDRFEPDYARSLSNYAIHLSDVGQHDEALRHNREALEICKRLAEKNPDRFEVDYARSMSGYASHLSEIGKHEEALALAQRALEIHTRWAERNPDRFEAEHARFLHNYASHLSDVGRFKEALDHARQGVEVCRRVLQKNPRRIAGELFSNTCFADLLAWLCDQGKDSAQFDLKQILSFIASHERPLILLSLAFVEACWATDPAARVDSFRRVLSIWADLSLADKIRGEPYWLCAAAWCAMFDPEMVECDWQIKWRRYADQQQGRISHSMLEMARRLKFDWPG